MEKGHTVAMVAGQPIYESDLENAVAQMSSRGRNYNTPEGRKILLEQLIAQKLFLADAKKTMLEYDPQFKAQLARIKDDLLFQFAVSKTMEKVKVTDQEIKEFFDNNPDQFAGQPAVAASHILVDSEEKANELLEKITSGEISFEDAAATNSSCPSSANGGSLGEFGRGQMVPEFDEACFSMTVGELRGPIKTQFGYHLIRLDAFNEAQAMKLEDVSESIREHLMSEKSQKAYQSRINQLKLMYPVDM